MKPRLHIDEEIEKTLSGLDHIQKVEAPPFFYTRLRAQLDKKAPTGQPFWLLVTRPAVSLAAVALLLVINAAVIAHYVRLNRSAATQQGSAIQQFAETYNLSGSVLTDKSADQ